MAATPPYRMPKALRVTTKSLASVLWLSGCVWLALHYLFPAHTQFGPAPNPWEATVIRIHGLTAIAGVYWLGWITARHVLDGWRQNKNHRSGIAMVILAAVLSLSGYALYYTTGDTQRAGFSIVHEVIGAFAIVAALVHWAGKKGR